jgi:hypothetical protein
VLASPLNRTAGGFPGPARGHLARKPANIDHVQAGALPLAALTAWQALVDTAQIGSGRRTTSQCRSPSAAKAHELGDTGHVAGKLVRTME